MSPPPSIDQGDSIPKDRDPQTGPPRTYPSRTRLLPDRGSHECSGNNRLDFAGEGRDQPRRRRREAPPCQARSESIPSPRRRLWTVPTGQFRFQPPPARGSGPPRRQRTDRRAEPPPAIAPPPRGPPPRGRHDHPHGPTEPSDAAARARCRLRRARIRPGRGRGEMGHPMEPGPQRVADPERAGPADQDQESRLEGVVGIVGCRGARAAGAEHHRPVTLDQTGTPAPRPGPAGTYTASGAAHRSIRRASPRRKRVEVPDGDALVPLRHENSTQPICALI